MLHVVASTSGMKENRNKIGESNTCLNDDFNNV